MNDNDEDAEDGENLYSNQSQYAKFVILEPKIMISTTAIVSSFPCVRTSLFSESFRNTNQVSAKFLISIFNLGF